MATPEIQGKLLKATRWSAGDKGSLFIVQTVLFLQLLMLSHTTLGLLKGKTARCLDSPRPKSQGLGRVVFFFH